MCGQYKYYSGFRKCANIFNPVSAVVKKTKGGIERGLNAAGQAAAVAPYLEKPVSDSASQYLFKQFGAEDWAKENPTAANAATFLGIPSLLGVTAWGVDSVGRKKPRSLWPYLLPMLTLGGVAWAVGSNYKTKELFGVNSDNSSKVPPPAGNKKQGQDTAPTANPPANPPAPTNTNPPETPPNQNAARGNGLRSVRRWAGNPNRSA